VRRPRALLKKTASFVGGVVLFLLLDTDVISTLVAKTDLLSQDKLIVTSCVVFLNFLSVRPLTPFSCDDSFFSVR